MLYFAVVVVIIITDYYYYYYVFSIGVVALGKLHFSFGYELNAHKCPKVTRSY